MRTAILMVRQDKMLVLIAFKAGVVCMLLALAVQYASPNVLMAELVINVVIIGLTLIAMLVLFNRTMNRYRYEGQDHAPVSGDAFLQMGSKTLSQEGTSRGSEANNEMSEARPRAASL